MTGAELASLRLGLTAAEARSRGVLPVEPDDVYKIPDQWQLLRYTVEADDRYRPATPPALVRLEFCEPGYPLRLRSVELVLESVPLLGGL